MGCVKCLILCQELCTNVIIEDITNASHIAQGFASHFVGNFYVFASNVNLERFMQTFENYAMHAEHICCELFTPIEVCIVVSGLKLGKAPGFDKIIPEIVVHARYALVNVLC